MLYFIINNNLKHKLYIITNLEKLNNFIVI